MRRTRGRPRLVGRTDELRSVEAAIAARAITPGLLVVGEPGIGKTRLVLEATTRARRQGATIASGACVPAYAEPLAFVPFVEALGRLVDELGGRADSVLGPERRELTGLLPGLGAPDSPVSRARQCEALRTVLERAGDPLVLVVEDLQWIDASSLQMLDYLLRKTRRGRLAVLATLRSGAFEPGAPTATVLAELIGSGFLERMDLGALSPSDVARLVQDIDPGASPATRQLARDRGDGNPLLIRELVVAGCESTTNLPGTLRDLLLGRIRSLDSAAQAVVAAAAVIGRPFHPALLDELGGSRARTAAGTASLLRHEVLIAPPGASTLSFTHPLLAEVVSAALDPAVGARLHARVARALTARPDLALRTIAGGAAEVAAHWLAAGQPDRALRSAVEAARLTAAIPANVEAYRIFERALALWPSVADPEASAGLPRHRLLDLASEAAFRAGVVARSVELERLAVAACPPADREELGRLQAALAKRLDWAYDIDGMLEAAEQAVALTASAPLSPSRGGALASKASALMHLGRFAEAEELARQATAIATGRADASTEAWARAVRAECLGQLGFDGDGVREANLAVAAADRSGDSWAWWVAHGDRRDLLWVLGWYPDRSARVLRDGKRIASRLDLSGAFALDWRWAEVNLWFGTGRWDEVESATTALIEGPTPAPSPIHGWARSLRGTVRVLRGRLDEGEGDLTAAMDGMVAVSEGVLARPLRSLAAAALLRHEPGRALELIDADLAGYAGTDAVLDPALLCALGVAAAATLAMHRRARHDAAGVDDACRVGDAYAARIEQLQHGPDGRPRASAGLAAYAAWAAAEAERLRGRLDPEAWTAAAAALARWNQPAVTAYARFREAEAILASSGDRSRAAQVLADAMALAARLGSGPMTDAMRRLARRARLALPTGTDRPAGAAAAPPRQLSPREREVLALLVDGRTNREIGRELFIAETTASVHVSHIMDKLGVNSRGAAVAVAVREGFPLEPGTPAGAERAPRR